MPKLCTVERNGPTPVQRRLSLTHVHLGKNIPGGAVLTSAMNKWSRKVFSVVVVVVVVDYPTPFEAWWHGGGPWSPRSRAPPQGLDQRS